VKRAKILKFLFIFLAAPLLIITISAAVFVAYYPKEKILKMVTSKAEGFLGRKVSIGDIAYGFGGVTLSDVAIYESGETSPILVSVERADIDFSILSLLNLELDFDTVSLKGAKCNIVFYDKNESNIGKLISSLPKTGGSGVSATISKIKLSGAVITLTNPPAYLAPLGGTYHLDGTLLLNKNIMLKECSIVLPENRGTLKPELTIKTSKNNFEISGQTDLENASLLWVYRWGENLALPYNVVNGTIKNLVITKTYVQGDVGAVSTLLNTGKVIRADGFCKVDIAQRTVYIGRTRGGIGASAFYIEGLHFTFDGKLIRFSFKNINADIDDAKPVLKFMPAKLFGRVEGYLSYDGGKYNGNLTVSNCGYDPDIKIISGIHATLGITNNMFKATGIPFNFYGNPCALSIAATESSLSKLYINISAEKILIDPDKNTFTPSEAPINLPVGITGIININHLQYTRHQLSNIQLQYQLSRENLAIKGFQFIYADGTVSGSGNIALGKGSPQAALSLNISKLAIQNAIAFHEKLKNRLFGQVHGKARIDFELSNKILQTARGNVEFSIEKGKLVDTGIQNGLGLLLSELKYKLRDMEFSKIYGNIDIIGTNYHIRSFIFNSNSVRLKIDGMFNQKLVSSPFRITLEFTREFIQDLPGFITLGLNKYQRGDWYIMPFIQNGDMADGATVKRAD
jgi:hypothetical protein